MKRMRLKYKSLAEIVSSDGMAIVTLTDDLETRALSIVCDQSMCNQLQMRAAQLPVCNIMLPEVLASMLSDYINIKKFEVTVYGIKDGQYMATIINTESMSVRQIRMSDAILLHVIAGVPLYIDENLMKSQSIPYQPDMTKVSIPINTLDTEKLKEELDKAVEEENYRLASFIKEELGRRSGNEEE